jgi:hypothetical protein
MISAGEKKDAAKDFYKKYATGPGLGLVIVGALYILFWIMPDQIAAIQWDSRWAHNLPYAIIIFTVGLVWFHASAISRTIGVVQSLMLPITASGSFDPILMIYVTVVLLAAWCVVVAVEKGTKRIFLENWMTKRGKRWVNMHSLIICWILIAHMALVFFIGRVPQETALLAAEETVGRVGFLLYLPPENHEYATWAFDIMLLGWATIAIVEQYKIGYNIKNKPWPKWSFYWAIGTMVVAYGALVLQLHIL